MSPGVYIGLVVWLFGIPALVALFIGVIRVYDRWCAERRARTEDDVVEFRRPLRDPNVVPIGRATREAGVLGGRPASASPHRGDDQGARWPE